MFFAIAVITIALVLGFNLLCAGPLRSALGFWGTAAAELGYAVIALAGAAAMIWAARRRQTDGVDGIEIFSTRAPEPKAILGGLLLLGAAYCTDVLYINIVNILFPEALAGTASGLAEIFEGASLPALLLGVAVIPAICEEMVFRGVLQYGIGRYGSPRVTVLLTGIVFGLFHIQPVRIPIAVLTGIALSYALFRSRSIFVPMLMHCVNNAASVVISHTMTAAQSEALIAQQSEQMASLGIPEWLLYVYSGIEVVVIAAGLLIAGLALFEKNPSAALKKHWVTVVVLGSIILILGAAYIGLAVAAV